MDNKQESDEQKPEVVKIQKKEIKDEPIQEEQPKDRKEEEPVSDSKSASDSQPSKTE